MSDGHLYLARCDSYPGVLKAGFTTRSPEARVASLSGAGSLARWGLVACRAVARCREAERTLHARFDLLGARVARRRELFRLAEPVAVGMLEEVQRCFAPSCQSPGGGRSRTSPRVRVEAADARWDVVLDCPTVFNKHPLTVRELVACHVGCVGAAGNQASGRLAALGLQCVSEQAGRCAYRVTLRAALQDRLVARGAAPRAVRGLQEQLLVVTWTASAGASRPR